MSEENKNQSFQDLETGETVEANASTSEPAPAGPVEAAQASVAATPEQPPQATAEVTPATQSAATPTTTAAAPANSAAPAVTAAAQPGLQNALQAKKDAQTNKKVLFGCLGGAALIFFIFLIIVFIFVSGPADTPNPLARLLGIDQNKFINGLITIVNLIFILLSLITVVTALVGFFRMSTAKKDDKLARRKGAMTTVLGIVFFVVSILIWAGVYLYLDSRRTAVVENKTLPAITTEPAETLNLTAPVSIRFDASNVPVDTRKYEIISYRWDFGNGETQTGQIVSYEFADKGEKNGRFDVLLTVTKRDRKTGEEIEDQFSKVISIANVKVNAEIKADPLKGPIPLTVKFDASASKDADGNIVSYEWDFDGDGTYDDASGAEVEHTFEQVGKYEVGVQVTDNNNEHAEATVIIEAEAAKKADAVITINAQGDLQSNVSYVFDAKNSKSPSGKIIKYLWNFGDGGKEETTRTISHIFAQPGSYDVELTVTDDTGLSSTITRKVVVVPYVSDVSASIKTDPALAVNSTTLSGQVPFKVSFSAEKGQFSPDLIDYEWDFNGDGQSDSLEQGAQYTYSEPGTYKASLKVTGNDNKEYTTFITIDAQEQGITAAIKASVIEGIVPLSIDFDASASTHPSSSITAFEWDFGDGSAPKKGSSKISYKFTKIGTFVVTVTALGADGSSNSTQININVLPVPLKACFEPSVSKGKEPLTVQFNSSCTTGTVVKYNWNFGDGGSASSNMPIHVFEKKGTYKVVLEVSDNDNVISTADHIITVE